MRYNAIAVIFIFIIIIIAHLVVDAPYSWTENTISELASQAYKYAWIMRLGFIGFGSLVTIGATQRIRSKRFLWYREMPLVVYGLGVLLSGIFSTHPFMPGVEYSEPESRLHSILATLAGVSISLGMLFYMLTEQSPRRKVVHLAAFVLTITFSIFFGMSTAGAGIGQRCLYLVGFAWLIYIETGFAERSVTGPIGGGATSPKRSDQS